MTRQLYVFILTFLEDSGNIAIDHRQKEESWRTIGQSSSVITQVMLSAARLVQKSQEMVQKSTMISYPIGPCSLGHVAKQIVCVINKLSYYFWSVEFSPGTTAAHGNGLKAGTREEVVRQK